MVQYYSTKHFEQVNKRGENKSNAESVELSKSIALVTD